MVNDNFYLAQLAKLYYIDKVKQNEIARRFNISPMLVSRALKEAEQKGLVTFHVKMPWPILLDLGKRVMDKYALKECIAIDVPNQSEIPANLGGFLADYFIHQLMPDYIVGLSWGSTISKFVQLLSYANTDNCNLIQLTGAFFSEDYAVTPGHIVQEVSKKLNARVYTLNAPLYVASEEIKQHLLEEPVNAVIHKMALKSNINIIGVSKLTKSATTYSAGIISDADYNELRFLGAEGDCAGTFLDKRGEIIQWSKSKLYTGVHLQNIQKADNVICVAGELEKVQMLDICAKKKYFNILITTKQAAEMLL